MYDLKLCFKMSAPYSNDEKSAYPEAAPPSDDAACKYPTFDLAQVENRQETYPQHCQPSNTAIVTQRHAPAVTYPVEQQRQYTGCAICALILSIPACLCFCWFLGIAAMGLASKFIST